jgi:hypothetical protein
MIFADCTAASATGDTTETLMGTITLSAKAKKIIGIWATAIGGATLTTGEAATGIFRLQSDSVDLSPSKWPLDNVSMLTGGSAQLPTHVIPVDIPVVGMAQINCYITMDQAQTGGLKGRVGLVYEG